MTDETFRWQHLLQVPFCFFWLPQIFGATYMVVAPEHPLLPALTTGAQRAEVEAYVTAAGAKSDLERTDLAKGKSGVFTGEKAGGRSEKASPAPGPLLHCYTQRLAASNGSAPFRHLPRSPLCAGSNALNPATGEVMPVWVADYVLGGYGSGAIMAVPAHDSRDYGELASSVRNIFFLLPRRPSLPQHMHGRQTAT